MYAKNIFLHWILWTTHQSYPNKVPLIIHTRFSYTLHSLFSHHTPQRSHKRSSLRKSLATSPLHSQQIHPLSFPHVIPSLTITLQYLSLKLTTHYTLTLLSLHIWKKKKYKNRKGLSFVGYSTLSHCSSLSSLSKHAVEKHKQKKRLRAPFHRKPTIHRQNHLSPSFAPFTTPNEPPSVQTLRSTSHTQNHHHGRTQIYFHINLLGIELLIDFHGNNSAQHYIAAPLFVC